MDEPPKDPVPPPAGETAEKRPDATGPSASGSPVAKGGALRALFGRVSSALRRKLPARAPSVGLSKWERIRKRPAVVAGFAIATAVELIALGAWLVSRQLSPPSPTEESVPVSELPEPVDADVTVPGDTDAATDAGTDASVDAEEGDAAPPPPPWRVSDLRHDDAYEVKEVTVGHRTVGVVLQAAGISRAEVHRVLAAFEPVHRLDRVSPKDVLIVAKEKRSGRVYACEYIPQPTSIYQAREVEGGDHTLVASKLALTLTRRESAVGILVGSDLRQAFASVGLGEEVLRHLDDALEGHAELSDLRPGTFLRILSSEQRVAGGPVLTTDIEAVEYTPPSSKALRVYHFESADPAARKQRGFYDAKGRRPLRGGFRKPIPFARISSRFNPRRMHPVLHILMPHNGVDFAATTGTPVYATAQGTVEHVGDGGPCGNMVRIAHSNGLLSAYCHLSRFASGLRVGQHVESMQLVGYVGATGRVTGPHLHFAVKKGDVFIDPLKLSLDGAHVLPHAFREEFNAKRAAFDTALDAIPRATGEVHLRVEDAGHEETEVFAEDPEGPLDGGADADMAADVDANAVLDLVDTPE